MIVAHKGIQFCTVFKKKNILRIQMCLKKQTNKNLKNVYAAILQISMLCTSVCL